MTDSPIRVAVFASGGGTTLQALLDHAEQAGTGWRVRLLVSDRDGIGALERAEREGVPAVVIPVSGRAPEAVGEETLATLADHHVQVICLAGYLRLVPESVVAAYEGRCLNVHPALLPAFGGRGMYGDRVHGAVLASGARITGPTVHLVDEAYDRGTPIAQWPVPVLTGDTLASLRARVQTTERALYPLVVDRLAAALVSGKPLAPLELAPHGFSAAGEASQSTLPARRREPQPTKGTLDQA